MVDRDRHQRQLIESSGPWPFVTRRLIRLPDGTRKLWQSRHHRKGLQRAELARPIAAAKLLRKCLWQPREMNWWIGSVFALGSSLFLLGSVLSLVTSLADALSIGASAVNAVFFAGSIPFTTAAYLQLFQAANAGEFAAEPGTAPSKTAVFGWDPNNIGWLSCAFQFAGTLLFNINTFDAMLPGLDWLQQDMAIWAPDFAGSVLFLASGYLAFVECCHAHWAWRPGGISWWVTFVNLLGCAAFMISAVFAFVPSQPFEFDAATVSVAFTLLGAVGFLAGSLLMLPETVLLQRREPQGSNS